MNNKLKQLYGTSIINHIEEYDFETYYYFKNDDHQAFGIEKNALQDNELSLLEILYARITQNDVYNEQGELLEFLFGNIDYDDLKYMSNKIKYFFLKPQQLIETETYDELISVLKGFLGHDTLVFKKGSILIAIAPYELTIETKDFVDSITSDFYVDLLVYESKLLEIDQNLPSRFTLEYNNFKSLKNQSTYEVSKSDLMYNYIISTFDRNIMTDYKVYVLGEYLNDQEMLNVVKTFFETNMNISLSAKKCFMHRNTFQNKIDRFISATGFNIKNFNEAFIVYLSLSM